jgi:hypothetical protein
MASFACSTKVAVEAQQWGWIIKPNTNPDNCHKWWMRIKHPTLPPSAARAEFQRLLNEFG